MLVYRITLEKWAGILTGSGFSARWNSKGLFVIYTASTRALACLENLVHRSGEGLNHSFCVTEIFIPDDCSSLSVDEYDLPDQWHRRSNYPICQQIGDQWLEEQASLLCLVPSSIIKEEKNILINPEHPEFHRVEVNSVTPFRFDSRL